MRVIVAGSGRWTNDLAVYTALNEVFRAHGPFQLIHNASSIGAAAMAHHWFEVSGRGLGCDESPCPANWDRGSEAIPECNRRMVEAGADLVLAFPMPEGSGTQDTMRLAEEAGIKVKEYRA